MQTNVLSRTPSGINGGHLNPRKPKFGEGVDRSSRDASLGYTNKVVKAVATKHEGAYIYGD